MKIIRVANEYVPEEESLWGTPEEEREKRIRTHEITFKEQDRLARLSPVFKRILDSEIKEDPIERLESTNSPKSKTRNAMLSLVVPLSIHGNTEKAVEDRENEKAIKEWEQDLLTNPFYGLS